SLLRTYSAYACVFHYACVIVGGLIDPPDTSPTSTNVAPGAAAAAHPGPAGSQSVRDDHRGAAAGSECRSALSDAGFLLPHEPRARGYDSCTPRDPVPPAVETDGRLRATPGQGELR